VARPSSPRSPPAGGPAGPEKRFVKPRHLRRLEPKKPDPQRPQERAVLADGLSAHGRRELHPLGKVLEARGRFVAQVGYVAELLQLRLSVRVAGQRADAAVGGKVGVGEGFYGEGRGRGGLI
jgi:hypothetical protein